MLLALSILWALFFRWAQATTSPSPSITSPVSATATTNSSHITVPIYCSYDQQYFVKVANGHHQSALARIDYLQPELWIIDGQHLLECDTLFTVLKGVTETSWFPSQVTYDHSTYEGFECFWVSAFYPTQTVTTTMDSVKTTTIQVQPTSGDFILDYANGVYASGVTATANISLVLEDTKSVELVDYPYLLSTKSNRYMGSMGLARFLDSGGILGRLVNENMTLAHSYSIFYFNESSQDTLLSGYLLPGSVDKSLYTGDFYSFPLVPYVGWGSLNGSLPIISLDNMELENLSTGSKAKVYEENLSIAIDPLLDFTYLPLAAIVNIALQTNAFYSPDQGLWVVKCSNIQNSNAVFNLNIGPLSLQIPLTALLTNHEEIESLKFSSGEAACVFNLFPSDSLGYPCIGSPLLRFIYMAMDNEGRNIALANANQKLHADDEIKSSNSSLISSGKIPFATTHSITSSLETFTFYQQNYTMGGSITALLSQVQLNSNGVYMTDGPSYSQTNSASAAQAASTTGAADPGVAHMAGSALYLMGMILLVGSVMGSSFA